MDKVYVKGQKLFITTEEATYDGTFHSMDEGKTRLTVKDVVKHPSEESFDGLYHFYRAEIISVQIMDPLASPWLAPGTEMVSSKISSIMRGCQATSSHKFSSRTFAYSELPKEKYNYYLKLLKKFVVIDNIGDEFEHAVEDIKKQSIIGVSFEGAQLGRKGKLSWISVCCPYKTDDEDEVNPFSSELNLRCSIPDRVSVYLFDLALMGSVAISNGLGDILQDESSPTKVIFDCRLPSDCLFHQFDVKLENVVDLQAAEAMTFRPKFRPPDGEGVSPLMFTKSLHQCLIYGLGLPPNLTYQPHINDGYLERNLDIWYQRPITSLMAKAAAYQSIYLINLWCKFVNVESMEAFRKGVQIYLSCVRDADDDTAYLMTNSYNRIPDEFVPVLMSHHERWQERRRRYARIPSSKEKSAQA